MPKRMQARETGVLDYEVSITIDSRVKGLETAVFTLIITQRPLCAGNVPESLLITSLFYIIRILR